MRGDERRVLGIDNGELEPETFRIVEPEAGVDPRDGDVLARKTVFQKFSASAERIRQVIRCTIPTPGRPRRAPGYSKNVRSAPGAPLSSA